MKKIFYCRAMDGLKHQEILEEYNFIKEFTSKNNMVLVNDYNIDSPEMLELNKENAEIVVNNNLNNLKKSDVVIVNISIPNHEYVGCIGEMIYAKMFGCYVITVVGNNTYDKHFWTIHHSDKITKTLDEALVFIAKEI